MKGLVDSSCRGCVYRGQVLHDKKGAGCCDYILHTEHRRPCPAGSGCTERQTKRQRKEKKL